MPRLIYCSPERLPARPTDIPVMAHDLDLSIFDNPIKGRKWRADCERRDQLLSMIQRCGNKAGHLSLLRNLARELCMFKVEERREAAYQRGEGIGLNPNLSGWGTSDGWADLKPSNTDNAWFSATDFAPQKSCIRAKWASCNGPVSSWTLSNGPVGLAPVKQSKQKPLLQKLKVPERKSPPRHSAPWMTVIKGKLPTSLRGGGVSRDRAKRASNKAQKRQRRSAEGTNSTPIPSPNWLNGRTATAFFGVSLYGDNYLSFIFFPYKW
ncbi:hypothetical protein GPALN_013466 [Globodera pallida]|nr:hypothetical protein GPALN_013466 [Globodera pallida]